ncbi:MAG: DUF1488 family protein [Sodalis sp. (in: enterobacteria)]|uniref:DUF1488 family protein n=1 Tax=Sodalis sp. (in: enterobacteria) TaxID=1898979 RepID=UPI0039E37300
MRAECQVSAGWLCSRFLSAADESNPLALFRQHRLDVEDTMESLIAQGMDIDGRYCLS